MNTCDYCKGLISVLLDHHGKRPSPVLKQVSHGQPIYCENVWSSITKHESETNQPRVTDIENTARPSTNSIAKAHTAILIKTSSFLQRDYRILLTDWNC